MAETTEQYRARINQIKTSVEQEPEIRKMRDDIAEGLGKTGNRQADIEIRQDTLEDDFVAVQQDASSASPSGAEVVLARGGYETLGKRLTEEETQISAQLEKKTELKIFSHIPSSSELSINELGLVLIPRFPIAESFNEVDGIGWNSFKFSTGKYEVITDLINDNESKIIIKNNKGIIRLAKGVNQGLTVIDNILNQHLDFKNLVKYRIKVTLGNDYKNLGQTGNTGFTISPDVGATVYYPDIGRVSDAYSVYINPTSSDGGYLRAKVRKIAGRNQIYDSDISKNGGFTTISTDRLVIPMGEVREFILEISTSSIKLMINNVLYLDVNEDLSWLTNNPCRLSLWGSNFDLNSTSVEHSFDNLLIEEVK